MAAGAPVGGTAKTFFRVKIWDLRGTLNTPQRPVLLKLNLDNVFTAETNIVSNSRTPEWKFLNNNDPQSLKKDVKFRYSTRLPERLPRKFLTISLFERNKKGRETEWGKGTVPLDVLCRGPERFRLSMVGEGGSYGVIEFRCLMAEARKVEVVLDALKVIDYPERHMHEVKMIYFEFGYKQFADGYKIGTEKSSESIPIFTKLPVLSNEVGLKEMLYGTHYGDLQIFFSFHRQVSRSRTEEIGIGGLPVRLIFQKVGATGMDVPSKFKVPLAGNKGIIKGKVLLRNIPGNAQLRGDDLVYSDGAILPMHVDLNTRRILPWLRLPQCENMPKTYPENEPTPAPMTSHQLDHGAFTPVNGHYSPSSSQSFPDSNSDKSIGQLLPTYSSAAPPHSSYQYQPAQTQTKSSGGVTYLAVEGQSNFAYVSQQMYETTANGQNVNGWAYSRPPRVPSGRSIVGTNVVYNPGMAGMGPHAATSDDGVSSDRASLDDVSFLSTPSYNVSSDLTSSPMSRRLGEWQRVKDGDSGRFYFANVLTQEALWLPPRWERREDQLGRQYFVDHNAQTTQFQFPVGEARLYRDHTRLGRA